MTPFLHRRRIVPDAEGFISLGTLAHDFLGMQTQYAARYVQKGQGGRTFLGDGIRMQNLEKDYHDVRVHIEDAHALLERILTHRAALNGMSPEDYRSHQGLPSSAEAKDLLRDLSLEECHDLAQRLLSLQGEKNGGRGIQCIRSIVTYLQRGRTTEARAIFSNDGDKIRGYPDLDDLLRRELGEMDL